MPCDFPYQNRIIWKEFPYFAGSRKNGQKTVKLILHLKCMDLTTLLVDDQGCSRINNIWENSTISLDKVIGKNYVRLSCRWWKGIKFKSCNFLYCNVQFKSIGCLSCILICCAPLYAPSNHGIYRARGLNQRCEE